MQFEDLCNALRATLSPNPDDMKYAETILKQNETAPGHACNLFHIVMTGELEPAVRLSASINLKRLVEKRWDPTEDVLKISDMDKTQIKAHIVEAVVRTDETLRSQLVEILKSLVYADYPESWPGLSESVVAGLHSQDTNQILGAVLALRCIGRKYEFKYNVDQKPYEEMMTMAIPKTLDILHSCAVNPDPNPIYGEICKAICKFYWCVTFTKIPVGLSDPNNFKKLMEALLLLVNKELPWENLPASKSEQNTWIWWKSKKWVLHLTGRFFKQFGSVDKTDEANKPLAQLFTASISLPMLEAHMQLLVRVAQLATPNERVMALLMNYMEHAVSVSQTYKVVKDHLKPMLINIVFPVLCFNDDDEQLWVEDPEEYVRKSHDFIEDIFGLKAAAGSFLVAVCGSRGKLVLQDFLNQLLSIMGQYNETRKNGSEPVDISRKMDGALAAIGMLEPVLIKKKIYRHSIEDLLLQSVVPCFMSSHGYLRSKACWVAGKFSGIKFRSGRGNGATFKSLLESVVMTMKDKELPVRVDAVVALKFFVEEMDTLDDFKFILKDLLEIFFNLMNEIENEDIVFTLETIVEKLGEDIAPFAENLGLNLTAAFKKCVGDVGGNEGEDIESLCAFGCLRAMNALIESVKTNPPIYQALENIFFPVIDWVFAQENMEFIEDVLDMVSYFVYYSPEISPKIWSVLPKLHSAYLTWADDYLSSIALCLENYIIKGKKIFLHNQDPNYMVLFNQIIETALTGETQEMDYHSALKLMEKAMQHLKGDIDQFIGPYIQLTMQKWKEAERSDTKVLLINVISNSLWYNASMTVHILRQQGCLQPVFETWFNMIYTEKANGKMKYFLKHSDKKIGILGLGSLLTLPDDQFPPEGSPTQVLAAVMKLLAAIKRQEEDEDEEEDEDDMPDDVEDESESEEGDEDADEALSNASSAYNKLLEKQTRQLLLGYQGSDSDDYNESDMSSDDEDAPIYTVDPYVTFADLLDYLEAAHTTRLQSILLEMDNDGRNVLHTMVEFGKQKKLENGIALNGGH